MPHARLRRGAAYKYHVQSVMLNVLCKEHFAVLGTLFCYAEYNAEMQVRHFVCCVAERYCANVDFVFGRNLRGFTVGRTQAKIRSRVWLKLCQAHGLGPEVGRCKVGSAQRNTRLPAPENQPCVWV